MKFKVQIDNTEQSVVASYKGAITIGPDNFFATVTQLSSMKRLVKIGEKSYEVRLIDSDSDPEAGQYLFELNGELISVTTSNITKGGETMISTVASSDATKESAPVIDAVSGGITAPMPGKIVNVLVKPGDKTKVGQVVVILEAMKMENELSTVSGGTVKAVLVNQGDSVQRDQVLLTFE